MTSSLNLDDLILAKGAHETPDDGMCVMEAVAYVADEPFTDHPSCASPILGSFLRSWNDRLDTEDRQRLKPYIHDLVGTADDGQEDARFWHLIDYLIRTYTPAWLDLAGLEDHAAALREHPRIDSEERVSSVTSLIQPAKTDARAAGAAAGAAAWTAAGAAAGTAAWTAAGTAAWTAAGTAARDAARDAAGAAARTAARDAAGAAARAALKPTVEELQHHVWNELLPTLIDPSQDGEA